ncbi:hypothetical protein ACQP00_20985 [Dactylosporangium sp. CS-047395]|uniref:hypothetical protein n=1 Tax=Dactylosporangium sp. CS-047395 TaxID=3239936 RepID=UPI003D93F2BD
MGAIMVAIHYTDRGAAVRVGAVSAALTRAALAALDAPSILGTQPWRWRVDNARAELHADPGRRLPADDPDGRLMMISCGAALHHARVALAAEGVGVQVLRFPDPADRDLLAVLRYTGPIGRQLHAQRLRRAIAVRRSDQRPFADQPTPEATVKLLEAAAEEAGARLVQFNGPGTTDAADRYARHAVITTIGDQRTDWLVAGEALSAVLLNATTHGLATSCMSDLAAAVPPVQSQPPLGSAGYPTVMIRFGTAGRVDVAPRPAHRPAAEIIELVAHPIGEEQLP